MRQHNLWVVLAALLALAAQTSVAQRTPAREFLSDGDPTDDAIAGEDEDHDLRTEDGWDVVDEPDEDEDWDDDDDDDDDADADADAADETPFTPRPPPDLPVVARHSAAAPPPLATPGKPPTGGGRSFGGVPVRDGAAPFQAEIYGPFPATAWSEKYRSGKELWELQHYCGGALIARDWVLTAAHCIDQGMVKAGYRVKLGAEDLARDPGLSYKIDRIVVHPGWNHEVIYRDDIALVHIVADPRQALPDARQVHEIPLYRDSTLPDQSAVTGTGWGKTADVEGEKPNAVLLKVNLNVIAEARCAALPDYGPEKVHARVFCAGATGRQTCRGDSGGPVVLTNSSAVLVGVVSWGKRHCAGDGQPGVYTRVSSYVAWIDASMRAPAR